MTTSKSIRKVLLSIAFLIVFSEAGIRLIGLTDFPIYAVNSDIAYIPKPSQSGNFLNKNSWVFNDRSMGTVDNWNPAKRSNILLIGNSIVMGGNPYTQQDKLGPLIGRGLGEDYSVWPIAAGGWTNVNETVYLEKNLDVVNASNFFIWEYMSGGLSKLSPSRGEYVFPQEKPTWATWYVLRRYVLPKFIEFNMSELPPTGGLDKANLAKFESAIQKLASASGKKQPGILFLYPGKSEFIAFKSGVEYLPERKELERIATLYGLSVVDIAKRPEWNESLYREGTHPTAEGNAVMARILTSAVTDAIGPR